jgi:hypothetical protein
MLGHDISMGIMAIIEVMSQGEFVLKRPAMFVISLAPRTDPAVLLTTNIFLKNLSSLNHFEVGAALSCLASLCTVDMAPVLSGPVLNQITANRPYIRKKVALALFRLIEKSPELYMSVFPKLKDLLADNDLSVQTAAVSAFLEIGSRNPKIVIPLIPVIYHHLKETKNNWMLIKLIKLMSFLCRVESRLFTKLVSDGILLNLLETTKAKSVEIELIRFVLQSDLRPVTSEDRMYSVTIEQLVNLIDCDDFNLKFLAISIFIDWRHKSSDSLSDSEFSNSGRIFQSLLGSINSTDSSVRNVAIRAIAFLINSSDMCREVIQHLISIFTQNEGKTTHQLQIITGILLIADTLNGSYIEDTEWFMRILVLLGSSESVLGDDKSLSRVSCQYKSISRRDPIGAMKISVAALTNPKLTLPIEIVEACIWVVGKYSMSHWQSDHFNISNCKALLSVVVAKLRTASSAPILIACITACLRFIAAARKHLSESGDLEDDFRKVLQSPENWANDSCLSVSLLMTLCIYENMLDKLDDTSELLMDDSEKTVTEVVVPADLDVPLVALPENLKPSLSRPFSTQGNIYAVLDEEYKRMMDMDSTTATTVTPADPLENLFTIKSVLSR